MILKKWITCLFCFYVVFVFSTATVAKDQAGSDIAFLNAGFGARAMGMGAAYTAMANDRHANVWNPAGLLIGNSRELGSMQTRLASDFNVFYLSGKYQLKKEGKAKHAFGFYWVNGALSDIPLVETEETVSANEDIDATDYFSYQANALGLSYARWLKDTLAFGINVTGFYQNFSKIDNGKGGGITVSPGLMWFPDYRLAFGFMAKDIINEQRWATGTNQSAIPEFRLGFSYALTEVLLFSSEMRRKTHTSYYTTLHFGFEYDFYSVLKVRMGFDEDQLTAGTGIYVKWFEMNYAYSANITDGLGDNHRVGLGISF